MATRDAIIIDLFKSKWYNEALRNIAKEYHVDDLNQEVMIVLMSKDPKEIVKLHESDYFKWYVVRVIMNIYRMPKSKFVIENNKYITMPDSLQSRLESIEDSILEDILSEENLIRLKQIATDSVLESLYWYDREIFNLWTQNMNAKKIARDTMISHREILRVISDVKHRIKEEYIKLLKIHE